MSIYPQAITGKYRKIRDYSSYLLLQIYLCSSWLRWERGADLPNQAILMDLPNRKAYIFSIEIWPDEAYYLTGILILAALGLFFITSLFGRIWCGYTCPHSVFVDLFIKAEAYFQGDRNARIKLDQQPWDKNKLAKKGKTFAVWLLIAFSFAFGWVCYFYDAPSLAKDIIHLQVAGGGLSWLFGLTASTFLFAGYVREKVCTYMCPYGRFQSAMLDNDTSVVTYHAWRGEPRGKYNPNNPNTGDCINCGKCVVVCPMGIDIRNGLQMQCIGCGLCIDACNSVMTQINRPLSLIAYDSVNSAKAKMQGLVTKRQIVQFKTVLFATIFVIVSGLLFYTLLNKEPLKIAVLRDRGALYTILPDGSYRNSYTLKVHNKSSLAKTINLTIDGHDFKVLNGPEYGKSYQFVVAPEEELELEIFVRINFTQAKETEIIRFSLEDNDSRKINQVSSFFITK
jgi:cytochrome c oxidase accessory protein FixG